MKTIVAIFHTIIITGGLGFLPHAQAVVPPPDGGYPGHNTAEGQKALFSLTTGTDNTALGYLSLQALTTGNLNTGVGAWTLALNSGDNNTAVGAAAMLLNTSGHDNVAIGTAALVYNDGGSANTANGAFALYNNTTGETNTAVGWGALSDNITASDNTGIGASALTENETGELNTAVGSLALALNIEGNENTALGAFALYNNTLGADNTAIGFEALRSATTDNSNTAVGDHALRNLTSGSNNVALGVDAGATLTTGAGNIYIGPGIGAASEDNHTYIRNIKDTIVSGGGTDFVSVNLTTGLLGHVSSSRRYKEEIKAMDKASETLYRLNPVTYRFKKEIDPTQTVEYGLVAEEVAEVDPNLAIRDGKGQIQSVRYTAINAMLLNEFLKEHRKVEEQQATIAQLKADAANERTATGELKQTLDTVLSRLNEQESKIQNVSVQLKMSDARRVVVDQ